MSKWSELHVYLRGGHKIVLLVTEWNVRKSSVDNVVTEFSWKMANESRLPYISLADIVAIVEIA